MASGSPETDSLTFCLAQLAAAKENPESDTVVRALLALRMRHIQRPGGIERFRTRGGLQPLLALVASCARAVEGGTGVRSSRKNLLDLVLSVLANCCTEEGCRVQVRLLGGIFPLVSILASVNVESIQNRAARALGNLAVDPDSSNIIHESGVVSNLVQILKTTQDSNCLQSAIRALRNLADTPTHRLNLARHGVVKPIAETLSSEDLALATAGARAIAALTKTCSPDCAEQLSATDGVAKLVALAGHAKRTIKDSVLAALANICAQGFMRPTIGSAGGIGLLVEEVRAEPPSTVTLLYVRALCLCCREAVNRARLREARGLELLLALLKDGRYHIAHTRIVMAFLNFLYDEVALDYLQNHGLVPLLVAQLEALTQASQKSAALEEEDDDDDGPQAASYDFPSEWNRRPDAEVAQAGESSSFLSLRSYLLSEGYIASPGDLSPQWSPDSGGPELEAQDLLGSASSPPCHQFECPGPSEECPLLFAPDSRTETSPFIPSEDTQLALLLNGPTTEEAEERAPVENMDPIKEHSLLQTPMNCSSATGPPEERQPFQSPSVAQDSTSETCLPQKGLCHEWKTPTSCRRRRTKCRSVSSSSEGFSSFSEAPAAVSTPIPESVLGNTLSSSLQQILLNSVSPHSASSSICQTEEWGPETPILLLLSRFSQVLDPSLTLVTKPVLQSLLCYVAFWPKPSPRCFRLLHRLTCNPNCLEAFVRNYGVSHIHHRLVLGLPAPGEECQKQVTQMSEGRMKELGEALLRNLSVQAESPFGVGTLTHLLLSGTEAERTACAVSLPLICRKEMLIQKLLLEGGGLRLMLESLARSEDPLFIFTAADSIVILLGGSMQQEAKYELQIPDSSHSNQHAAKRARKDPDGGCRYQHLLEAGQTDVKFQLDSGDVMSAIRAKMSAMSEVFRAMLEGGYLESWQTLIPICDIPLPAFRLVLHFLHGCQSRDCPTVLDLHCVTMEEDFRSSALAPALAAADRFLLPGLRSLVENVICETYMCLSNLHAVYTFSEHHGNAVLRRRCLCYLLQPEHEPRARGESLERLLQAAEDLSTLVDDLHGVVTECLGGRNGRSKFPLLCSSSSK
ncbi:armadillo repeat-containing protein 5 [Microcaecilia unicolor]|uniref:Armadillo repeat-containing protein 5 n=1 Tax=Microcaecilia unicolor TaxID=1415580 RepID=A0A6P7YP04_9AMPH|nr:armadillo repeat-containing protein 5 [Microcaecilia unicolor]